MARGKGHVRSFSAGEVGSTSSSDLQPFKACEGQGSAMAIFGWHVAFQKWEQYAVGKTKILIVNGKSCVKVMFKKDEGLKKRLFSSSEAAASIRLNCKMLRPSHDVECIGRIILNAKSYSNGHHLPQELYNIVRIY